MISLLLSQIMKTDWLLLRICIFLGGDLYLHLEGELASLLQIGAVILELPSLYLYACCIVYIYI